MIITLEKNAIVFTLKKNSINLNPLLIFIDSSFKRAKHFSNATVILNEKSEEIKKKYLLKWAYKIHEKTLPDHDNSFFERLIDSYEMPIHIITSSRSRSVAQVLFINIYQINSFEISVTLHEKNEKIVRYFKHFFKENMSRGAQKASFRVKIKTKQNLLLLRGILAKKEIFNTPVTFITQGLNFKRLDTPEPPSPELLYKEKIKKSYKILNISDDTTLVQVKKNYRDMLRKYHPDVVHNQGESMVKLYTKRFQAIQNAYELLKEHHRVA